MPSKRENVKKLDFNHRKLCQKNNGIFLKPHIEWKSFFREKNTEKIFRNGFRAGFRNGFRAGFRKWTLLDHFVSNKCSYITLELSKPL